MGALLKYLDIIAKKNDWKNWSDVVFNAKRRTISNLIESADQFYNNSANKSLKELIEYEEDQN